MVGDERRNDHDTKDFLHDLVRFNAGFMYLIASCIDIL
jgi:hypothetical protein